MTSIMMLCNLNFNWAKIWNGWNLAHLIHEWVNIIGGVFFFLIFKIFWFFGPGHDFFAKTRLKSLAQAGDFKNGLIWMKFSTLDPWVCYFKDWKIDKCFVLNFLTSILSLVSFLGSWYVFNKPCSGHCHQDLFRHKKYWTTQRTFVVIDKTKGTTQTGQQTKWITWKYILNFQCSRNLQTV